MFDKCKFCQCFQCLQTPTLNKYCILSIEQDLRNFVNDCSDNMYEIILSTQTWHSSYSVGPTSVIIYFYFVMIIIRYGKVYVKCYVCICDRQYAQSMRENNTVCTKHNAKTSWEVIHIMGA